MLRYENLNDISDGRIYMLDDKVCAGTNGCAGCSKCCESDMGCSIVLDPYDMYELKRKTGKGFDELLVGFYIELSMIDGIVLPNMKMDHGCKFLENRRCTIHDARPSICRLFPLGRLYKGRDFSYILEKNECAMKVRTEVSVRDWIGYENPETHADFIIKWHEFLKFERRKVNDADKRFSKRMTTEEEDKKAVEISENLDAFSYDRDAAAKEIMKTVIKIFYLDDYDTDKEFYGQFEGRIKECIKALRELN